MTKYWQSLADSHARGYAGEILYHVKPLCKITGYITPNGGLLELPITTKEEIRKSTTEDTVLGGTNDISGNLHGKILTLREKFLVISKYNRKLKK